MTTVRSALSVWVCASFAGALGCSEAGSAPAEEGALMPSTAPEGSGDAQGGLGAGAGGMSAPGTAPTQTGPTQTGPTQTGPSGSPAWL